MARIAFQDFAYPNSEPDVLADPFLIKRGSSIKEISASAFADLLSGPTIDVFVGEEQRHWSLHLNLLCYHSSYFESDFGAHDETKNAEFDGESTLDLPHLDPSGFELLVKWLYQGRLEEKPDETDEGKYDYAVACQKLYLICDEFDIFSLKNQAIDACRANLHAAQLVPDAEELDDIYRASRKGSSMRRLMAQIAARQIMDPASARGAEAYRAGFENSTDFAIEVVNAIKQMSGGMLLDDPTGGGGCEWHDHSDGGSCIEGDEAKPSAYTRQRWQRKVKATASKQLQMDSSQDPMSLNRETPHTPSNTPNNITAIVSKTSPHLDKIAEETTPVKNIVNGTSPGTPKQSTSSIAMNESRKLTPPTPQSKKSSPAKSNPDATIPKKSPPRLPTPSNRISFPRRVVSAAAAFDTPKPMKGHVNGIVRQINGTRSPSEASSGRRPKKLELRGGE